MDLLNAFGIDYRVLIAQLLNFAVLFFVLYRFGYKSIFRFLDDRKKKIEEGVTMAEAAKEKLSEALEDKRAIIVEAKKEAAGILAKADMLAQKKHEEIMEKAKKEVASISAAGKHDMLAERERMMQGIKNEVADLIALSLEKITKEKIGTGKDMELIREVVRQG